MTRNIRARGQDIRGYILRNFQKSGLAGYVADHFGVTRQAVNAHLQKLVDEGALLAEGNTRNRSYKLASTERISFVYRLANGLDEDVIWRTDIRPFIGTMPENVLEIWHWAFTEMFNNAIDHSGGSSIYVEISKTAIDTEIAIADDGVGIFKKIQKEMGLLDERQAIFELSKGKLTTDQKKHSGQGIFFTSRMVSGFDIVSGGIYFSHEIGSEFDTLLEGNAYGDGTTVFLKVENHTSRSTRKVLDSFSTKGNYGFTKTIVPVKLAKYGSDQLISRSQAKRVLARVELFEQVVFDFSGVDTIGQAFADEIFRVFATLHPEVALRPSRANPLVLGMINAAIKTARLSSKHSHLSS